jgi:hypothetical protein
MHDPVYVTESMELNHPHSSENISTNSHTVFDSSLDVTCNLESCSCPWRKLDLQDSVKSSFASHFLTASFSELESLNVNSSNNAGTMDQRSGGSKSLPALVHYYETEQFDTHPSGKCRFHFSQSTFTLNSRLDLGTDTGGTRDDDDRATCAALNTSSVVAPHHVAAFSPNCFKRTPGWITRTHNYSKRTISQNKPKVMTAQVLSIDALAKAVDAVLQEKLLM